MKDKPLPIFISTAEKTDERVSAIQLDEEFVNIMLDIGDEESDTMSAIITLKDAIELGSFLIGLQGGKDEK